MTLSAILDRDGCGVCARATTLAIAIAAVCSMTGTSHASCLVSSNQSVFGDVFTIAEGATKTAYVVLATGTQTFFFNTQVRITGLPSSYVVTVTPTASAQSASGDPFGAGGNLVFAPCAGVPLVLYTLTITRPLGAEASATLSTDCVISLCGGNNTAREGGCTYINLASFGNPSPAVGAEIDPPPSPYGYPPLVLSWTGPIACDSNSQVFIGTSTPDTFVGAGSNSCPVPWSQLSPGTTYFWRVVMWTGVNAPVQHLSPIWSFSVTPGDPVAVQERSWSEVRRLYQ